VGGLCVRRTALDGVKPTPNDSQNHLKLSLVSFVLVILRTTIPPYVSTTGYSTIRTNLNPSTFFPSPRRLSTSSSTNPACSCIRRQVNHSQAIMADRRRRKARMSKPVAILARWEREEAISSKKEVSIWPQRSKVVCPSVWERRDGFVELVGPLVMVGNAFTVMFPINSVNVSFISSLSFSNGTPMISFTIDLNSSNVGMLSFSLFKSSSNPLGRVTFAKASNEGMVNTGMERLTLTIEVTLLMALRAVEMT
jgi:hypothetical protein